MLWIKAFHVVFMVTWFAGLFYLPRLFVYHAMSNDTVSIERFVIMERKLFWGIMTPGAAITVLLGVWMLIDGPPEYIATGWMQVKLATVVVVIAFHMWCGKLLWDFRCNRNTHSHMWYRCFNEIPVLFLVIIVIMTIVRPL